MVADHSLIAALQAITYKSNQFAQIVMNLKTVVMNIMNTKTAGKGILKWLRDDKELYYRINNEAELTKVSIHILSILVEEAIIKAPPVLTSRGYWDETLASVTQDEINTAPDVIREAIHSNVVREINRKYKCTTAYESSLNEWLGVQQLLVGQCVTFTLHGPEGVQTLKDSTPWEYLQYRIQQYNESYFFIDIIILPN